MYITGMADKPIAWIGSALDDLRGFPEAARRKAGQQLRRVQYGSRPTDSRPMKSIGKGVYEIRIREEGQAHRVFYVAGCEEAVYVLHAFEKKSQKTSRKDLQLGEARYRQMLQMRREHYG